jgi:pyruvate carboxylase
VVEIAPAPFLDPAVRDSICESALKIGRAVGYQNAGTVEFLFDTDHDKFYFIEVNPRIQVEHTVTETVTGIDLVRSQILVADGHRLHEPPLGIPAQRNIECRGVAIQ